jgi:hypothetical protein
MKKFLLRAFSDKSDLNPKVIVGFSSFIVMTVFAFADIGTGLIGKDLVISDFIYNSFLIIVLGSLGISGVENLMGNKNIKKSENANEEN